MKKFLTSVFFLFSILGYAQTTDTVVSQGGVLDVYYDFETTNKVSLNKMTWDIGLTTDMRGASIIINENGGVELFLYGADTSKWSVVDTTGFIFKNSYNSESTWNAGAFANQGTFHPDYGWGIYDMNRHNIDGNRIFILKTKTGMYKKVVIDQMSPVGVYKLRIANLDGGDLKTYEYSKTAPESLGKNFALLNVDAGLFIEGNPLAKEWDILFTKYITSVSQGPVTLDMAVSGIKINAGCQVAERNGMDVSSDDTSSLTWGENITEIGYDWKSFNRTTFTYDISQDRAYFVRTKNGAVYKIWFTDYTLGSGNYLFTTKEIKAGTASTKLVKQMNTVVYPNPVSDVLTIENKESETLQIRLTNAQGLTVYEGSIRSFGTERLSVVDYASGVYFLQLHSATATTTKRMIFD